MQEKYNSTLKDYEILKEKYDQEVKKLFENK